MEKKTTKLKVAVELNNGDLHRVECSSINIDKYGIEIYGTKTDLTGIKYEDVSLMSICVEDETQNETLTFRLVKEPKVAKQQGELK